jgi:hypothetical protein
MRWLGDAEYKVEMGNACSVLVRKCEEKMHMEYPSIYGRIILKQFLTSISRMSHGL